MLERLHGLTHPGRLFAKSTNGNILEEADDIELMLQALSCCGASSFDDVGATSNCAPFSIPPALSGADLNLQKAIVFFENCLHYGP